MFDRGAHIEVFVGSAALCHPGFVQMIAEALTKFGQKPVLVLCDGPAESVEVVRAYDNGLKLASIATARIAIVLGGREPTTADRLTDLTATNRGTRVRSFGDLTAARAWLSGVEEAT